MDEIILSRKKLYDLVWSEPLLTLAKKYNISDVGLRKVCIRMGIPLPKSGYLRLSWFILIPFLVLTVPISTLFSTLILEIAKADTASARQEALESSRQSRKAQVILPSNQPRYLR